MIPSGAAEAPTPLEERFVETLGRLYGETREEVMLAVRLLVQGLSDGHVCLDLRHAATVLSAAGSRCPDAAGWQEVIADSPLVRGTDAPCVLDNGRLYLRRYWQHEQRLAQAILARARSGAPWWDPGQVRPILERLFRSVEPGVDWQRVAVIAALRRRFAAVSGGPGTGKTTTVARLLAALALLARQQGREPPRAVLAAPTAKAAQRLESAIGSAVAQLDCPEDIRRYVALPAATIHRVLRAPADGSVRFGRNRDNPIPADVLIVDEASMVPLALMARLVDALPGGASLVLLGDRDQLASVEAGSVLGDVCNAGKEIDYSQAMAADVHLASGDALPPERIRPDGAEIRDSVVQLRRNYRFGDDSELARLAAAVRSGDAEQVLSLLDRCDSQVQWYPCPASAQRKGLWREQYAEYAQCVKEERWEEAIRALDTFRVLCALRRGPEGVSGLNAEIEAALSGELPRSPVGRPILVTQNDYDVRLFNGDQGIIGLHQGAPLACFPGAGHGLRQVVLSRVPPWEPAFALTVHKSQGSEYERVALVLPEVDAAVVTRELVYTGITRARSGLILIASPGAIAGAVTRPVQRTSGLREKLWCGEKAGASAG